MKLIEFFKSGKTIQDLKDTYKINARSHSEHNNLVLFKYDQIESPMGDPLVQECRGVILNMENLEVVSRPFDKFFNHGETHCVDIDWNTARVQEKLDGSLMTLYFYNGEWHVSTSGTPDACAPVGPHEMTFKHLFWKVFNDNQYVVPSDTRKCYMFELMTPYNRVVVRHDFNQLKLIGVRDLDTMAEVDISKESFGFQVVEHFHGFNDIMSLNTAFKNIDPVRQEGYIVVDANFNRVKVKHPGYVLLHRAKDGLSTRRIVDIIKTGESAEVLTHFPEWQAEFDTWNTKYEALINTLETVYATVKDIKVQKEFALAIENVVAKSALFTLRANKVTSIREFFSKYPTDNIIDILEK